MQWSSQSEITPCHPVNPLLSSKGVSVSLRTRLLTLMMCGIPILDGTDHSELIALISVESSAEALKRLKEEQKKTYGSRRPLVKWWLQESAEEEEARKNKGWEL